MIFKKKKRGEEIIDFSDGLIKKEKQEKKEEKNWDNEFIKDKILEIYDKIVSIEQEIFEIKRILKKHG